MSGDICGIHNCTRARGHMGCHVKDPSMQTLRFDMNRGLFAEKHVDDAVSLLVLDFETPPWADLLDDGA